MRSAVGCGGEVFGQKVLAKFAPTPHSSTMKLSIKTLTNEQFTVDVADSGTVLDAKKAIEVQE